MKVEQAYTLDINDICEAVRNLVYVKIGLHFNKNDCIVDFVYDENVLIGIRIYDNKLGISSKDGIYTDARTERKIA